MQYGGHHKKQVYGCLGPWKNFDNENNPFPILLAAVQKNKGIKFFISEGYWTTVVFCMERNMEMMS